jgi:hypothetical protein
LWDEGKPKHHERDANWDYVDFIELSAHRDLEAELVKIKNERDTLKLELEKVRAERDELKRHLDLVSEGGKYKPYEVKPPELTPEELAMVDDE